MWRWTGAPLPQAGDGNACVFCALDLRGQMSEATASILVWISISGFAVSLLAAIGATGFWMFSSRKVSHVPSAAVQLLSSGQQAPPVPAGQMPQPTGSSTPAPPGQHANPASTPAGNPAATLSNRNQPAPGSAQRGGKGSYRDLLRQRAQGNQKP